MSSWLHQELQRLKLQWHAIDEACDMLFVVRVINNGEFDSGLISK